MAIAGYADTMPVDSNETEEGRAHNRRVDVVILNQQVTDGRDRIPAAGPHSAPPEEGQASVPPAAAAKK